MPKSSRIFIPATMATQHPDNACAPFWERDGDGFVSIHEELRECVACYQNLGTPEFMWDWEGKYTDEAVADKLFTRYYEDFKRQQLGVDKFLIFRIPNVSKERGYSLMRALMVILTAEDFAQDLRFHAPPLFEVILPMVEHADQPLYIQDVFEKLARFKARTFTHLRRKHSDYLRVIPLFEGVDHQANIRRLLDEYVSLHFRRFGQRPSYLRPFLARSDPALVSGLPATMLANKLALSELALFSQKTGIPTFPILGVGSLIFRGGLTPHTVREFLKEYGGVRTVTIQSAFRYDFPLPAVRRAITELNRRIPKTRTQRVSEADEPVLRRLIERFAESYQRTLSGVLPDLEPIFSAVPKRRERHLHIGMLAYKRRVGKKSLPRAINFTAACYSIGVPPELIGYGRVLNRLTSAERMVFERYYKNWRSDLIRAGRYLNRENLEMLAIHNPKWRRIIEDVTAVENSAKISLVPRTREEQMHANLSSNTLLQRRDPVALARLIVETGKLRGSLG